MKWEEYKAIYTSVWNFHKKYQDVKDDDEYWEQVVDESNKIAKQYVDSKFVVDMLLAVISELERVYKEMMKNEKAQRRI